jgi:general secretion pathway protein H
MPVFIPLQLDPLAEASRLAGSSRGRGGPGHRGRRGRNELGLTLLEIMIVMILMGLMMGVMIFGSGQLTASRLKRATTMVAGAVRVAFTRATARSRSQRLVFDLDEQQIWLEESDGPMLVQPKDTTATGGGAAAVTEAERLAFQENDNIMKGPRAPKAMYHSVETLGFSSETGARGPRAIGRGLRFREVQIEHDDQPRTKGRAYLYFWPGGQTERASIELAPAASNDDQDVLTLNVLPLTGKVTIKNGPVALVIPTDDLTASERVDRGGSF